MLRPSPEDNPICFLRPRRTALSAWIEHVPFGMYLIDLLRPASIVELGTRNGVSYSAFCQAVRHLGIAACCVAVDSWHGDPHTGAYSPSVLDELRLHHDPLYGSFSRLQQGTFDEAVTGFDDASVDLLHIDGFHTYEAASRDFRTWLPKLSSRGVVLFHDIAEHGRDFGVWRLWAELSGRYPSFAFHHGHGLGVLAVGADVPGAVVGILSLPQVEARRFRRFFHREGRRAAFQVTLDLALSLPARSVAAALRLSRKLGLSPASGG